MIKSYIFLTIIFSILILPSIVAQEQIRLYPYVNFKGGHNFSELGIKSFEVKIKKEYNKRLLIYSIKYSLDSFLNFVPTFFDINNNPISVIQYQNLLNYFYTKDSAYLINISNRGEMELYNNTEFKSLYDTTNNPQQFIRIDYDQGDSIVINYLYNKEEKLGYSSYNIDNKGYLRSFVELNEANKIYIERFYGIRLEKRHNNFKSPSILPVLIYKYTYYENGLYAKIFIYYSNACVEEVTFSYKYK
ncbi:MAG: hypothetical protein K1X55_12780 [Chitinophagales bacterium]|nr:hypothetical protein [Chitinophagales bacterium]